MKAKRDLLYREKFELVEYPLSKKDCIRFTETIKNKGDFVITGVKGSTVEGRYSDKYKTYFIDLHSDAGAARAAVAAKDIYIQGMFLFIGRQFILHVET